MVMMENSSLEVLQQQMFHSMYWHLCIRYLMLEIANSIGDDAPTVSAAVQPIVLHEIVALAVA